MGRAESEKKCFVCDNTKLLSDFYKHPGMTDGCLGKCKECCKMYIKKRRELNVQYYREHDKRRYRKDPRVRDRHRKYEKTDAGKASLSKSSKKWTANNPEKRKAHHKVNNAVRDGKLIKPDKCQCCNNKGRLEGHHEDYSKPFDVIWLCRLCHTKIHREANQEEKQ